MSPISGEPAATNGTNDRTLHTAYRPQLFKQVMGQAPAVTALTAALKHKSSQCFLLSGPSGLGKTTLARIAARKLSCQLQEIDGAHLTGVNEMREVVQGVQFLPFGQHKGHAVIIDECHRISPQAWDSLLKATEEPPAGVYWFFCTTNPDKVPGTIKTRALHLQLKSLDRDTLGDLVAGVAVKAGIDLEDTIRQLVVAEAHGSPRQALVNLAAVRDAKSREQAAALLRAEQQSDAGLQLCRTIAGSANQEAPWPEAMQLVERLLEDGESAEGLRIRIMHYMAAAIRKADPKRGRLLLARMEPFVYGYGQSDGDAMLVRSVGASLLSS